MNSDGGRERGRERERDPIVQLDIPFCETVPEDFQCGICLTAAREAVVTEECGHLFCRACISSALDRKKECPVDRTPLNHDQVRKDVRTQRKIQALSVWCYNKKGGCAWKGCLSDLEKHCEKCDFATVKCPFQLHGCDAIISRKTLTDHIQTNVTSHLLLLCTSLGKLQEENIALQQELDIIQRSDERFIWVIPNFESKRGPVYSRKFTAKNLQWYLGVDFECPDQHAGVYLFAEGHSRRVDFKLILFNVDAAKDKIHTVNDWSTEFKGKGWGPLKFINRTNLEDTGFLVNNCVRIGVEIESDPFE
uniref:RING-type E3 ubiquitin transferase n=1 Tax=Eutreptiella gymnastica TaxID=73025 RepID=A0A7S1NRG8_9EUGL|mmetsp:Transcript_76567/g.135207  ORF Transcript_76567/g.135207 Transcript_76567/m.135207 type:complete len:306 (+) Transcript_76567:136-1053(+)